MKNFIVAAAGKYGLSLNSKGIENLRRFAKVTASEGNIGSISDEIIKKIFPVAREFETKVSI